MPITEHTINDALAEILRKTRSSWRASDIVKSENTGTMKGSATQPDILVIEPTVSPVAIETEIFPANTVEVDAISRLGKQLRDTGRKVLSSVAMRLPARTRTFFGDSLKSELEKADDLEIALFTGNGPDVYSRWPKSGWIIGSVADLSVIIQFASVPPDIIANAAYHLECGVNEVAGLLEEMSKNNPGAIHKISQELCQEDGDQTRRMASAILANAFLFHEILAGGKNELATINSLDQLKGSDGNLIKSAILTEWRKILKINYWPIFDIARRILEAIPTVGSNQLIENLEITADALLQNQLMRSHDLTGAVFQRLIADRKFLAAFYTTPSSAALLAGLAITPELLPTGKSWSNADDVISLRIADFACGTGTLLSTAYQQVSQLHEIAGGNAERIHNQMMANALIGCDVLPAAAHLTASMLAGAHPNVNYFQSSILTVAYGKQPDGTIALGSLDLLDPQGKFEILSITAKASDSTGETEKETWKFLPHASFDVVIMNPPFTRATGQEGKKIGVPNPMFAAFSTPEEEQRLMAKATERLIKGTSAHGNAGEASFFLVLADRKLKCDGKLALVMPLSLISGEAWENSRILLEKHYSDLVVISISGIDDAEFSFSADTGMGECLVIGRRSKSGSTRATFVVLNERPANPLVGMSTAKQIRRLTAGPNLHHLEDGPTGGTPLHFGDEIIGQVLNAPLPLSGGWNLSRIADLSLAQAAYQMANEKNLWLPTMSRSEAVKLPITSVSAIGEIGPYHADINGITANGGIRGPFDISPVEKNSVPSYPVLWAHDAKCERTLLFDADCEGLPRKRNGYKIQETIDLKVANIWNTASHCHFNRDFQFNSQATGMQFTTRKTIGGRAWISIRLSSIEQEKALVLWGNTTLGMLMQWWHSNKQQSGRGSVGKVALQTLPVLDVTALTPKQIDEAAKLFDFMFDQQLLPLHEIDRDSVRKSLDEQFGRNVLELPESILKPGGPLELLRMKLSREPSIRGQK